MYRTIDAGKNPHGFEKFEACVGKHYMRFAGYKEGAIRAGFVFIRLEGTGAKLIGPLAASFQRRASVL